MKICPHCSKEFNNSQSLGGHMTKCKLNPNYYSTIKKIVKTKQNKQIEYLLSCKKCHNPYTIRITEKRFDKNNYNHFCSRSCANSHEVSIETKNKISKTLIGKSKKEKEVLLCNNCKKEITKKSKSHLCRKCVQLTPEYKNKISKSSIGKNVGDKNGMYGKSPKNTKNIKVQSDKHTKNKDFSVRSSYEQIFVDRLNSDNDVICFTYEPREYKVKYIINGRKKTYQPDFLINDNRIVEIKNSWNVTLDETTIKKNAFMNEYKTMNYEIIFW